MAEASQFICEDCGRRHKWKFSIAGRKARCACGAVLDVPANPPPAGDDLGTYDIAASPATRPAEATIARAAAINAAVAVAHPAVLNYDDHAEERKARQFSARFANPVRDLYMPVAFFIAGFLVMMAWCWLATGLGVMGATLVSVAATVATLIKLAILLGLALWMARGQALTLGDIGTMAMKFAGALLFSDAARLWLWELMRATGAVSRSGHGPIGVLVVDLVVTVLIVVAASYCMFTEDNAKVFGILMATISWLCDAVLLIALAMGLRALTAAASPRPAPPAAVPSTSPTSGIQPTDADRQISQRIGQEMFVKDAWEWKASAMAREDKPVIKLVNDLYRAGANKIYIDLYAGDIKPGAVRQINRRLYVRCPEKESQRSTCLALAREYRIDSGMSPEPASAPDTRQFLVIELKVIDLSR